MDWLRASILRRRPTNAEVWPGQEKLKLLIEREAELYEELRNSCAPISALKHNHPEAYAVWGKNGVIFLSDRALELREQFGKYLKGEEPHTPLSGREVRKLSKDFGKLPKVIGKAQLLLDKTEKNKGERTAEMFTNLTRAAARAVNYRSHLLAIAEELRKMKGETRAFWKKR